MVTNRQLNIENHLHYALDNIDDILNVPGIDFVFFGRRDFSMSCGYSHVKNPATNSAR